MIKLAAVVVASALAPLHLISPPLKVGAPKGVTVIAAISQPTIFAELPIGAHFRFVGTPGAPATLVVNVKVDSEHYRQFTNSTHPTPIEAINSVYREIVEL